MQTHSRSGVTLLETVIAIAILNVVLIPILGTLNNLLRYHSTIRNRFQANLITQRQLETAINILQSHQDWQMIATSTNNIAADVINSSPQGSAVTYALVSQPEDSTVPYFDTASVPQTVTIDDDNPDTPDQFTEFRTQITIQPVCRRADNEELIVVNTEATSYNPNAHCNIEGLSPSDVTVDTHSVELVALTEWSEPRTSRDEQVEMRTLVVDLGIE